MCARSVSAIHVVTPGHCGASFSTRGRNVRSKKTSRSSAWCDDVDELLEEKPGIDRVNDRFDAGYAVVELEVAVAVPGERSDALARDDAQALERARELPRPAVRIAVGVAVDRSFDRPRHDLGVAMAAVRVADER